MEVGDVHVAISCGGFPGSQQKMKTTFTELLLLNQILETGGYLTDE